MQSEFLNLYPYKQINRDRYISNMSCVLCHLTFCLIFLHLCILDSFSNPRSKLIHYQTLLVHVKQVIIKTNLKSSTHVSFTILSNMLAFSLYCDIPQHRSHFIDSICIVVFFLGLYCFHDLPTQQYIIWPWFEHYVEYHQVCLLVEPVYTSHFIIHKCM
jgi:hypothetical protein